MVSRSSFGRLIKWTVGKTTVYAIKILNSLVGQFHPDKIQIFPKLIFKKTFLSSSFTLSGLKTNSCSRYIFLVGLLLWLGTSPGHHRCLGKHSTPELQKWHFLVHCPIFLRTSLGLFKVVFSICSCCGFSMYRVPFLLCLLLGVCWLPSVSGFLLSSPVSLCTHLLPWPLSVCQVLTACLCRHMLCWLLMAWILGLSILSGSLWLRDYSKTPCLGPILLLHRVAPCQGT